MIKIKNKQQSVEVMKELGLNYFPLQVFEKTDLKGIKEFFESYPSSEYVLRTTDKAKGNFYFVDSFEQATQVLENFDKNVTVSVSYNPFKDNIVLVGDIKVEKGKECFVHLTARDDSEATHRNIYEKPKYNYALDIEDDRLWEIDGFEEIIKYILKYDLLDCVVEFAVYDIDLGINKEKVVITEIRTSY